MSNIAPDAAEYYLEYKTAVYDNLFVGIIYGIYVVLYAVSVHILLARPGLSSSPPRIFMLGMTTFMFILGLIALVLETVLGFQQMKLFLDPTSSGIWSSSRTNVVIAVGATITRMMYISSDIICAWRAVVIWNKDKRVMAILLLFILGTTAAAGSDLGLGLRPLFSPSHDSIQEASGTKLGERALIMVGPTLGTNILSTGLIAWKAWQHRVFVGKHLGEGNVSVRVEKVLALLIESGFVYCCLWILYLISAFRVFPEPGFTVMDAVLLFASGSYPTLIIILVCMQKSPVDYYSNYSTGIQFAAPPTSFGPHKTGIRRNVYSIHREYITDSETQVPSTMFVKTLDRASGDEKSV
ncbi:hypothetical protein B0F90DRAFT_1817829 [Multifurca ochricompacta]|uniref:Uncharacterized protein n=1 Tax=Multifurca ochricompacta TaxID=376703 RepID=A0AAD4QKG6_9AGAM|nr:hypothetical protein B0F90DRAFT_1817829 [Multifurca ochricompacta]